MSGLLSIEEALARIQAAVQPLPAEVLALENALGRVTADVLRSTCDLPPFDQSSMDGYALRAADLAAQGGAGARLPLRGLIAAGGQSATPELPPGAAARIFTGGMLPAGADSIVRQEITRREDDSVLFLEPVVAGTDVRRRGEELRAGDVLLEAGQRITAPLIGALGAAGVAQLPVHRRPRIWVLVTGDEIVPVDAALRPGEVHDANGPMVRAWLRQRGYPEPELRHVADEPEAVAAALAEAFAQADLILTTGGVSVGDRDLIAPEAERLGAQRLLWKVAQKPGKPLYVAHQDGKLLMGLPGNPASVFVNLVSFVHCALARFEGLSGAQTLELRTARLAQAVRADAHRASWLRMRSEPDDAGCQRLHALPRQASHMLSNLAQANALAWLPVTDQPLPADTVVPFIPI
jgi:molybdopterin molybdotransferase